MGSLRAASRRCCDTAWVSPAERSSTSCRGMPFARSKSVRVCCNLVPIPAPRMTSAVGLQEETWETRTTLACAFLDVTSVFSIESQVRAFEERVDIVSELFLAGMPDITFARTGNGNPAPMVLCNRRHPRPQSTQFCGGRSKAKHRWHALLRVLNNLNLMRAKAKRLDGRAGQQAAPMYLL